MIAQTRAGRPVAPSSFGQAAKAGDLACERYVLSKGKLQIEVLCNLDQVAPAGAILFAAWPNFEGATGLPARVWAVTE